MVITQAEADEADDCELDGHPSPHDRVSNELEIAGYYGVEHQAVRQGRTTMNGLWITAAQAAIDAHNYTAKFDTKGSSVEVDVYQLLASLIAYCEHNGIDEADDGHGSSRPAEGHNCGGTSEAKSTAECP